MTPPIGLAGLGLSHRLFVPDPPIGTLDRPVSGGEGVVPQGIYSRGSRPLP